MSQVAGARILSPLKQRAIVPFGLTVTIAFANPPFWRGCMTPLSSMFIAISAGLDVVPNELKLLRKTNPALLPEMPQRRPEEFASQPIAAPFRRFIEAVQPPEVQSGPPFTVSRVSGLNVPPPRLPLVPTVPDVVTAKPFPGMPAPVPANNFSDVPSN